MSALATPSSLSGDDPCRATTAVADTIAAATYTAGTTDMADTVSSAATHNSSSSSTDSSSYSTLSAASRLRNLLGSGEIVTMPCCQDGLTARLIERAGFDAMFMSGFCVAAAAGHPDTGLLGYEHMVGAVRTVCEATSLPVIADGDTGYGNEMNTKRTVMGYARAGAACIMIEDQLAPKRCGHVEGKRVVSRGEAVARVVAAVDAKREIARQNGLDILIMARTDARHTHGLEEALDRCRAFVEAGADITFLEAPRSEVEMRRYTQEVRGWKMANMLENGVTPVLPPSHLQEMGFHIAAHPVTLLSAATRAMQDALILLKQGKSATHLMLAEGSFGELKDVVGFGEYAIGEKRYAQIQQRNSKNEPDGGKGRGKEGLQKGTPQ